MAALTELFKDDILIITDIIFGIQLLNTIFLPKVFFYKSFVKHIGSNEKNEQMQQRNVMCLNVIITFHFQRIIQIHLNIIPSSF